MNNYTDSDLAEKFLSREVIFEGKYPLWMDEHQMPDGRKIKREHLHHPGGVAVLAINEEGNIAFVKQYRYAIEQVTEEIPAGKLDFEGEDLIAAVRRELMEETGISAGKIEYLCPFYPVCAYSTEVIHLFFATGLSYSDKRDLDVDESINIEMIDIADVVQMIYDGKIPDAKTQCAVLHVWSRFCQKGEGK